MYAVGRLGSYITRGVSTVSGPFHPFGGAVDIVVVQQKDGSLKSSPWYVRFGKFQGVLKAKEKIVDINVNGVEADFHMYLNPRGEAYFLREKLDSGEIDTVKLKSLDHNFDISNATAFSRNLGFVLDRKEVNDDSLLNKEDDSVKSAKIAAELLETKWCTTLSSITNNKNHGERKKDEGEVVSGKLETSLVLHEQHFVNNDEVSKKVDEVVVANVDDDGNVEIYEGHTGSLENSISKEERLKNGPEAAEEPLKVYTEVAYNKDETCSVVSVKGTKGVDEKNEVKSCLESNGGFQDGSCDSVSKKEDPERFVEEQFGFSDLDNTNPSKSKSPNHEFDQESFEGDYEGLKGSIRRFASDNNIAKSCKLAEDEAGAQFKSLPNMWSGFDRFDPNNFDNSSYYSLDHVRRSSKWEILRKDASRIIKEGDEGSHCANALSKDLKDGKNAGNVSNIVDDTGKSWSLWPFTKSRSKKFAEDCKKDCDIDSGLEVDGEKEGPLSKSQKMQRALTPTPEQLQTLNLTEGKNTVTFTFSTAVLGNQQVDARIFLWKWDTRIVISDVDGTITKSDVLGQFMPLVGRDWSHIGVTHLFSAIKENGYQIIFLSARSISQADITRQFLFNLKQEGKALPDGPVVISPDGLFPSLFREVIRRAPHEFKIACLADIKACFPEDWNPFYAGFGNRDTDEFSYLKVGIPKGKIFIINPKGEVVNRSVDSKSYSSLHAIVNGIFPPISVHEESKGDNVVKEEKETNEQPGEPNSQWHMARDGSMSCSVSRSNV